MTPLVAPGRKGSSKLYSCMERATTEVVPEEDPAVCVSKNVTFCEDDEADPVVAGVHTKTSVGLDADSSKLFTTEVWIDEVLLVPVVPESRFACPPVRFCSWTPVLVFGFTLVLVEVDEAER